MDSIKTELTNEYLAKLSNIRIKLLDRINIGYGGERKSNLRGSSLEFSDFKDYTPGDDGSRIDWNSYSRLDKLFIKMFEEEKRANIYFFIDISNSMGFGEFNKLRFAKLFAASAAYIGLKNSDAVNILTYDEAPRSFRQGIFSRSSFPGLVEFLDKLEASGKTQINSAISQELSKLRLKLLPGVSFLISDFLDEKGCESAVKFLQSKKQAVNLIHVLAKEEISPESDFLSGMANKALRLTDSETGGALDLYLTNDIISLYDAALTEFTGGIRSLCAKRQAGYFFAPSDMSIVKLLALYNS